MAPVSESRAYMPLEPPMYTVFPSALRTGEAEMEPTPTVVCHLIPAFGGLPPLAGLSRIARTLASAKPRMRSVALSVSLVRTGDDVVAYWPTPNFHLM